MWQKIDSLAQITPQSDPPRLLSDYFTADSTQHRSICLSLSVSGVGLKLTFMGLMFSLVAKASFL
ncbi:MAG: hypothetical protein NT114_02005 [Patescibacteria group bacterium]|nr:hypothetical protein [Patescibacteria group bacterium]